MKFIIDQKTFLQALEKGAMAALSEEAQAELNNAAPIIKSVKISLMDDKMILESGCKSMVSRYILDYAADGSVCLEKGHVLVPAKDLIDWVSKQSDSKIRLTLQKFAVVKMIAPDGADMDNNASDKNSVKQIGTIEIVSVDATKTGNKWSLDCYDPDQFNTVDFDCIPSPLFNADVIQLREGVKNIAFAAAPKDSYHVYNSIKFQTHKNDVYMGATDKARCALYKLEAGKVDFSEKKNGILVLAKFLNDIISRADATEPLSFSYDSKGHKIFIYQKNFYVRLVTADVKAETKFSNLSMLIDKQYNPFCKAHAGGLASRLITVSMVNKLSSEFTFKKSDKGSFLRIYAVSESGKSPLTSTLPVTTLREEGVVKLGTQHLLDILKVLKDEEMSIDMPDGLKGSIRVVSTDDPRLQYFLMTLESPKGTSTPVSATATA